MNIDRRNLLKGSLLSAAALPSIADPGAAFAQIASTASHGSECLFSLLERARLTETKVHSVNRIRINSYIADDYRLADRAVPEIVWFENLETFVIQLLNSSTVTKHWEELEVETLVADHFTWDGSSRYWQKFAQGKASYDWRRYRLIYDTITTYLRHDCVDNIGVCANAALDTVIDDPQWHGVFSEVKIDHARNAIGSINSAGILYAYAVSLIDAALLAGVSKADLIIKEMIIPIEAFEAGFWCALVVDNKLLCVERPKYVG